MADDTAERSTRLVHYNRVLFAVLGTGVAALGLVVAAFAGLLALQEERPATIPIDQQDDERRSQELVFCAPTLVPTSGLQLLPVAVRVKDEPDEVTVTSPPSLAFSKSYERNCALSKYGFADRVFNVVVRGRGSDGQRLLIDRPAMIEALYVPDERCDEGIGAVPCGILQWHIRDRDTNGDGAIGEDDALIVYHSSSAVEELRPVTPSDASIASFTWDPRRNSILYQVRFDRNEDRRYNAGDPTEILELQLGPGAVAEQVIARDIRDQLQAQIQ